MTNSDRIRNMADEELMEVLKRIELGDIDYSVTFCDLCKDGGNALGLDCDGCLLHWLQTVEDFGGVRCQRGHQTTVTIFRVMGNRDETAMVSAWGLVVPTMMSL